MPTPANGSGFKIRRALPAMDAFAMGVDKRIKSHLDKLNNLLGKRVFHAAGHEAAAKAADKGGVTVLDVLGKELTPKRGEPGAEPKSGASPWARDSVTSILDDAPDNDRLITLAGHIDTTPDLVELKYAFQKYRQSAWTTLDFNTRAVLQGYPNIEDFLIAFAFHEMKLTDVNALCSFIVKNSRGARRIVNYSVVSASRTLIDEQKLDVENYNDDKGKLATALQEPEISLSATAFQAAANARIKTFVFDTEELDLINGSKFGSISKITPEIKSALVKYMQKSPYEITRGEHRLPHAYLVSRRILSQGIL